MQQQQDEIGSPTDTGSIRSLRSTSSTPLSRPERFSSPLDFASSHNDLPYRPSRKSLTASLYASTLSPPGSRSISPAGRRGSPALSGSIFEISRIRGLGDGAADNPGDPLNLILRSFVPHVAVYSSSDADFLLREKGFENGLWELLRPYGERIQGKVTVRDSNGGAHSYDNYAIRFTRFGDKIEQPLPPTASTKVSSSSQRRPSSNPAELAVKRAHDDLVQIEEVVRRHLDFAEDSFKAAPHPDVVPQDVDLPSPYYALYLRRLLSHMNASAHETFAHPVACVMAISSRNQSPIEEFRRLYQITSQGDKRLPEWIDNDYLRYYVLVHDEDRDDLTRSESLFEQMKRHLGLHCHLLRIRTIPATEIDVDAVPHPRSDWLTAAEELATLRKDVEQGMMEEPTKYIWDTDVTALRLFVREMVTQSVIPTMERHVMVWNDQVASRRRGIAGRFITLSKKWPFGGGSSKSAAGVNPTSTYDATGYYTSDASEAILRKLADFAFMLRDWKLANSTYDILRTDFNEAKAWKYYAAANEMAAVSLLILPQSPSSRSRSESVDQMLESAFYSYNTRCNSPFGAIRTLILGLELLRPRGGGSIDDAVRWGTKLLDSKLLGVIGDALIKERMAICYASKRGVGTNGWGRRTRKAALWNFVAAENWTAMEKHLQAWKCLKATNSVYEMGPHGINAFAKAREHMDGLETFLCEALSMANLKYAGSQQGGFSDIEEEAEVLGSTSVPFVPSGIQVKDDMSEVEKEVKLEEEFK